MVQIPPMYWMIGTGFLYLFHGTHNHLPLYLGRTNHLMVKKSELGYVRKRKRKKAVAILTAIAAMGVGVFVLVSFLGRFVGTFTVALDTGSVKLSLSEKSDFDNSTSYIKIDALPSFDLSSFTSLPGAEEVDNENTSYLYGTVKDSKGNQSMKYFKYTFFVRNTGNIAADYDLKINLTKNVPSADGRYLDTLLRVLVYENDASSNEHSYTVYAKKSETPNQTYGYEEGETTFKEYISYDRPDKAEAHNDAFPGFAEMFESDNVIATIPVRNFQQDDAKRYTLVAWLEGEDQQAKGNPPEGGNLKLGVTINAYENQ